MKRKRTKKMANNPKNPPDDTNTELYFKEEDDSDDDWSDMEPDMGFVGKKRPGGDVENDGYCSKMTKLTGNEAAKKDGKEKVPKKKASKKKASKKKASSVYYHSSSNYREKKKGRIYGIHGGF
jgi:hypothetical protein